MIHRYELSLYTANHPYAHIQIRCIGAHEQSAASNRYYFYK